MLFPASLLLPVRQGGIDGDPVQPGGKRGFASKSIELADHLEQDVLRDVLGIRIVAEHAAGQVEDPRAMLVEDLLGGQGRRYRGWRVFGHGSALCCDTWEGATWAVQSP